MSGAAGAGGSRRRSYSDSVKFPSTAIPSPFNKQYIAKLLTTASKPVKVEQRSDPVSKSSHSRHSYPPHSSHNRYMSPLKPSPSSRAGVAAIARASGPSPQNQYRAPVKPVRNFGARLSRKPQPPPDTIWFYDRDERYYEFTNFYRRSVTIGGSKWPTTEHYFQAQKFVGTPYVEYVRKLSTPREAFQFSRLPEVRRWLRKDWSLAKDDIMKLALLHKFEQHKDLREKLVGTGNKRLVEHTSNDSYWGDGGDDSGLNKLGKLLMDVRQTMRIKHTLDDISHRKPVQSSSLHGGRLQRASSFSNLSEIGSSSTNRDKTSSTRASWDDLHLRKDRTSPPSYNNYSSSTKRDKTSFPKASSDSQRGLASLPSYSVAVTQHSSRGTNAGRSDTFSWFRHTHL